MRICDLQGTRPGSLPCMALAGHTAGCSRGLMLHAPRNTGTPTTQHTTWRDPKQLQRRTHLNHTQLRPAALAESSRAPSRLP